MNKISSFIKTEDSGMLCSFRW